MNKSFQSIPSRAERASFISRQFHECIRKSSSILDVGCFENDLKNLIGNKVFGIDIAGHPDKKIDLEKESLFIFRDNEFDLVICTEVLEHLDNLHQVLDNLVRISKKYVIISLPNCPDIWKIFEIIFHAKTGKFYGLPLKKPFDRHKWFFSWKESRNFIEDYCRKQNLTIQQNFLSFSYGNSWRGLILKSILRIFPLKIFSKSYWVLIEKKHV